MPGTPSMYKNEMTSYYQPTKTGGSMMDNTRFSGSVGRATSSQFIIPFVRHNRDYRIKKNLGVYINDSSHNNPSDPNSMRDQGIVRNAPYHIESMAYNTISDFHERSGSDLRKSSYATSWKGFPASVDERPSTAYVSGNIKNRDVMNQSFYRFGGKTPITKHVSSNADMPKLNSHFNTILSSKLQKRIEEYNESKKSKKVNIINKDPLVRV
jgi:hypothetical protein